MTNATHNKKFSVLVLHIIAWGIIFLLPYIFTSAYYDDTRGRRHDETAFLYLDTVTKTFWLVLFYLNTSILIPRFIYAKKYILFGLVQVVIFLVIMQFHGILFKWMISGHHYNFLRASSHNIIAFLFTITVSIAYKTITDKSEADAIAREKQQEQLKTELAFLRFQISPHFLFNVLNNIVAMVRLKSEELEPTIIKLSSLMQYMLYETDEEKVLLKSEAEYLQSYIDLQQQRFSEKLTLNVSIDLKEDWHTIEPMLLIPFVENAFKHGTGLVQNPVIEIELKAANNQLDFIVKNKFIETDTIKDKTSGIGLANVKRRLELLYGGRYHLSINKTNDMFAVALRITFKR